MSCSTICAPGRAFCTGPRRDQCLPWCDGLAALPDADVKAIATYFADIDHGRTTASRPSDAAVVAGDVHASLGIGQELDADARLYAAACGSCHYNRAARRSQVRPDLALNSALSLPEPTNLHSVVLDGIGAEEGMPGVVMPGFAHALSDADIARIGAYLRRTRTELASLARSREKSLRSARQIGASNRNLPLGDMEP